MSRILQTLTRVNFVIAMTGETGIVKLRMAGTASGRALGGPR
jgi:hypothetical protein